MHRQHVETKTKKTKYAARYFLICMLFYYLALGASRDSTEFQSHV